MACLLVVGADKDRAEALCSELGKSAHVCTPASPEEELGALVYQSELVLVDVGSSGADIIGRLKEMKALPVLAIVPAEGAETLNGELKAADDFVTGPADAREGDKGDRVRNIDLTSLKHSGNNGLIDCWC